MIGSKSSNSKIRFSGIISIWKTVLYYGIKIIYTVFNDLIAFF